MAVLDTIDFNGTEYEVGANVDETLSIAGKAADAKATGDQLSLKVDQEYVYVGISSDSADLIWNQTRGTKYIVETDLTTGKTIKASTGEVIDSSDEGRTVTRLYLVKPNSQFYIHNQIYRIAFYTKNETFISITAKGYAYATIDVPTDAYYARFEGPYTYFVSPNAQTNYIKSNYIVQSIYIKSSDLHVEWDNILNKDVESLLFNGTTNYRLSCHEIKRVNEMRHAFRIASFNIYVGNRNRWTELKTFLQPYGIDIIGFQEVSQPLNTNSSGLTFEQALTSWNLSQFAVIQTEDVSTNCRPVAATSDFEVVSIEETKYTTQSNYGHRHFTKTQLKLPRWKDKKASENFMVSIYNTQLEVGTGSNNTRLAQANELLATVAEDTNPFIVILGDFNEMSTGWDTINLIRNAGFTPQLTDTSTPTAGRGFYDFIFVNERMSIVDNDVIPYDLHNDISDHDLVFADVVFDYSNLISVKTSLPNCTLTGGGYWLDRRQTEPVVYTVVPDEGYTVSSIATGQGDNDLTYSNGAVVKSGNTVTITPNLVVGDVWINVTTTANS